MAVHSRNPLIYWHLLSLDAPSVAMLWTWFIAAANRIHLPAASIVAMGTAVWLLYAADRLLDVRNQAHLGNPGDQGDRTDQRDLEDRHYFHFSNRQAFLAFMTAGCLALAVLVRRLPPQALHLYAILGILLSAYFALIHLKRDGAPRLPKEIAVGVFFSAATFIPTVARNPALRSQLLPAAILFGAICSLNCLCIYEWEHPAPFPDAHPTTRAALRLLLPLACLIILGSFTLALRSILWQVPLAVGFAASLLLLLHIRGRHLAPTTLRAAADLCLLTPIVFIMSLAG